MNEKDIKETEIWTLYSKSLAYARRKGYFEEVDKNNNFYNGDQWEGLLVEGVEPVQYNFIKPIVNYKVNKVTKNLRAINYSASNVEDTKFRQNAKKICDLFNQRAARVWENGHLDYYIKLLVKYAAIDSESIMYVSYDKEENNPTNEILNKIDVFYGNENDDEIQLQPYILIKQRMNLKDCLELADKYDVSKDERESIVGDMDSTDEAGKDAKDEVDNMITVVTKLYKQDGKVYFSKATKFCTICKDINTGLSLYPLAHFIWEQRRGSARGEGEVRALIPNQIETNKTAMRRILTTKNTAYPQKIFDKDKITNPRAIDAVGGTIEVQGMGVEDVRKAFATTQPSQMSPDAERTQRELIQTTRELANASDAATGQINPENASGRAILAVQQASEQPLDDQNIALNKFIENLARIWLDMWKTYNKNGINLEVIETDANGEEIVRIEKVNGTALEKLKTSIKIDITPKGSFDKYAQELSLENLAKSEMFMNTRWLEDYVELLDSDSTMPKLKIEELIKKRKQDEEKIRRIQQQGAMVQNTINQLMNNNELRPKMQQPINETGDL